VPVDRPDFSGEEFTNEYNPEIQDDRLAEALERLERGYDIGAQFEIQLMVTGLLPRLEQARIIPVVENPNPYNPELNEKSHERWWQEHPEQEEKFTRDNDKRSETLRNIYIGALLGSGPWPIP
jgi:hypothetical protein